MAEILDLDKVEGFFRGVYLNILNGCAPDELQRFNNLRDDESRVIFMMNLKAMKELKFTRAHDERSEAAALQLKKNGNTAFLAKNWQLALDWYNKCVLQTPTGNGNDLWWFFEIIRFKFDSCLFWFQAGEQMAIALANRSAALYHLEKYDLSLRDIALAEQSYPKEMMYKLKERAARCHLANRNLAGALKSFRWVAFVSVIRTIQYNTIQDCRCLIFNVLRETITNLSESKLPFEKHAKLEKDAQIMIKILPRQIELEKQMSKKLRNVKSSVQEPREKLHKCVMFDYNALEGRYAKTSSNIKVGEELLCEKAHCTALLQPYTQTHCQHCFTR